MAHRDVIVIGTSAGGIEALQQLLAPLPPQLDAAILIVLHTSAHPGNMLPRILGRATRLPVSHPRDGEPIQHGHIYIAPPNYHMIVEGDLIRIIQGPRENLHRPAIDPLFRSAAESFGRRVIGVILTGSLDDGTSGLMVVAAHGGRTVVQDPRTALFASMPESALEQVPQSEVASIADMAACLTAIVAEPLPDQPQTMKPDPLTPEEIKLSELDMSELEKDERPGRPSVFACPDCGGVLWELEDHGFLRFRCRVGHAYTARHLGAEQRQSVESSLWAALRALEERAALYRRMAERADASRHPRSAERFRENEADNRQNARILRDFLLRVNRADEDRFADEEAS